MGVRQRQVRAAERHPRDGGCAETRPFWPAEPRYRSVLITWLAICPLVTAVLAAGQALGFSDLPLVARSVILTAVVVPVAVLWVVPALRRISGSIRPADRGARELDAGPLDTPRGG